MSSMEADLVRRAQDGDDEAFAGLVDLYQRPVYNLCYRMLGGSEQAAEDAAQETFWRAYQAIRRYDPQRSFATWILSIAAHYCIDQQRKRRLPLADLDEVLEETAPDPHIPNPEHTVAQTEQQRALHALLNTLGPQDKAAVILRYWYDYSEQEIANSLNLSVSAVKSRLHRARLKLAEQWSAAEQKHAAVERI
ncbi:MAG TPA: sigma-70 family RNA polymerase sigma factor [Chloroflexi bacterium]|nr:sigma-70 family RNA polymerase sigma factor [Chloroflexota bacterium]